MLGRCSVLIFCSIALKASVLVTPTIVPVVGGYEYSYGLTNVDSSPILGFLIDAPAQLSILSSPVGWDGSVVLSPYGAIANWITFDGAAVIGVGATLTGFSLFSPAPPGTVSFIAIDDQFSITQANTIGPVAPAVPEPSTWALLATGLGSLGLIRRKTMKR